MNAIDIKDLPMSEELDRSELADVRGGIGRTPVQILAWEMSGKPATWNGMVLSDGGGLEFPII